MAPQMIPEYCPYCGNELGQKVHENNKELYCMSCERFIWRNPDPVSAVIVSKDEEVLFIKRGVEPSKGKWSLPAGFLEVGESAREAASRELEEETSLDTSAGNLSYVTDTGMQRFPDQYLVAVVYSIRYSKLDGQPTPGSDAEEARFWRPDTLENHESEDSAGDFMSLLRNGENLDT